MRPVRSETGSLLLLTARGLLLVGGIALVAACASGAPKKPSAAGSAPARTASAPSKPAPTGSVLFVCKMAVSNSPPMAPDRRVLDAPTRVSLKGVSLRLAPVSDGCLSSGFGPRGAKQHKGIDYFARNGDVLAAGAGVIKEAGTRADFGNMILIDHGGGVYTRYAHLASFARPLAVGEKIKEGTVLGPIGASGAAGAPHLHYEILSGAYVSGVGSFGLTQHDPFALPGAK